jgi:RNA polymerase sigma-70 factor (ECF subfamily)
MVPDPPVHGRSHEAAPPIFEADPGEARLVAALLDRDRKAAAEFVARYSDAVYGYVRRRLIPRVDLADDLVQEVFLAALDGLRTYRAVSSLQAWLLGIARHKVEAHYRTRIRAHEPLDDHPDAGPADDSPPIDDVLARGELAARARDILAQLPEIYAIVLSWRYWESRSVREIANATGRTEKAVERLLARARARFRELWDQ